MPRSEGDSDPIVREGLQDDEFELPKHCSSPELEDVGIPRAPWEPIEEAALDAELLVMEEGAVPVGMVADAQASCDPTGREGVVVLPVVEDQRLSKNAESTKLGVECDGASDYRERGIGRGVLVYYNRSI